MSGLRSLAERLWRQERGSVLILAAAGFAGMTALAALSVDVGNLLHQRAEVQKAVDAAVLAGSIHLPANTNQATADARSWAEKNGLSPSEVSSVVVSSTYSTNDTLSVTASRDVAFFLGPVLGNDGATTTSTAMVTVSSYRGGNNLMPWGLVETSPCYSNGQPVFGTTCTLKYGASSNFGNGDFGALQMDGPGASHYREAIANGSSTTWVIGALVDAKTGNMVGPTRQGIEARLASEGPGCGDGGGTDTFSEVFTAAGPNGVHSINCPDSPRIIIIPVVDQIDHQDRSTILDFVLMYLNDFEFAGGHSTVTGRIIAANWVPASDAVSIMGAYNNNGFRTMKLTE